MKKKRSALWLVFWLGSASAYAERMPYPPEELTARREALCASLGGEGTLLLFGGTMPHPGYRFRQDHDFFYFTGNEDLNTALAIELDGCKAHLFLPVQDEREVRSDGWNLLHDEEAAETWGYETLHPLGYLGEFLARGRTGRPQKLFVRLSERDEVNQSRGNKALYLSRRFNNPWSAQPSLDAWRVTTLRERYPYYELIDASPFIDALRVIKTAREIEILRHNAAFSAEAIRRAIEVTRPGRFEYELEAEAKYVMLRNGSEANGYPAIVGSGPNVNIWHYRASGRQMKAGELVVVDYGASLSYLTVDITRSWPVSGRFDELQEKVYRCVLEAQKAILASMKPGVTRADTREIGKEIYEKHGFGDHRSPGAGHFVGLSVHDVGDRDAPFEPGMVIAVEPIIEIKEKQIHVRIEDTVLITEDGVEVLTSGVPKEVDEILALVGSREPAPITKDDNF